MAEKRTVLDFATAGDPWSIVDAWASENGYKPKETTDSRRLYQRGIGFWVAPQMLLVETQGDNVHLEAWIRAGLFVRFLSLFILPAEIHIGSGGMKAAVPRKMARQKVNGLLEQLGQPPID